MPELDVVVGQVVPVIGATVSAYGAAVLAQAENVAAIATAGLGQRLVAQVLHRAPHPEPFKSAVIDPVEDAESPDALAAVRLQLRKVLQEVPDLLADLAGMLPAAASPTASGARSVAIGGNNSAPIVTGDRSRISGE